MGRGHAARQGDILAGLGLPGGVTAFSSPQLRTRQTAEIALDRVGLDPVFDDRLKEVHLGSWEGQYYADLIAARPEYAGTSVFRLCLASDGETEADLRARVGAF